MRRIVAVDCTLIDNTHGSIIELTVGTNNGVGFLFNTSSNPLNKIGRARNAVRGIDPWRINRCLRPQRLGRLRDDRAKRGCYHAEKKKTSFILIVSGQLEQSDGLDSPLPGGFLQRPESSTAQQRTDQLQTGFHLVLSPDPFSVLLHGVNRNLQLLGNLQIGNTLQQQDKDVSLPWRQRLG